MGRKVTAASAALLLGVAVLASPSAARPGRTIVVTTTIQAAVDAAHPGDTILVPPGTYRESVLVTKSNLTITGSPASSGRSRFSTLAKKASQSTCAMARR